MLAVQILVEALNGSDEFTKDQLLRLIKGCGYTVRSDEEEATLRQLVNLADINSGAGLGEPPRLDDAAVWAHARFMQLRAQSRMEVSAEELCEYPQPSITDLLDALDVPHERTVFRGLDAILGFISYAEGVHDSAGGTDGQGRAWGVAVPDTNGEAAQQLEGENMEV